MDIKTGKAKPEPDPSVEVPPDRSRPARKKTAQKPPRSRNLAARVLGVFKVLAGVSMIALLVLAAFAASQYARTTNILRLHQVLIEGCKHADTAQIESIIRREFSENLLRADLAGIRVRLQREPWIRRVEIRRMLPETLRIRIQERVPSVIAEIGGELQLLDNEGILLDQYSSSYGKLDVPIFSGLKGDSVEEYQAHQKENSARIGTGVEVLNELSSGSLKLTSSISEIDLSDEANVKLILVDDTAEIYLGDREFKKRFQMLMANLSNYQGLKAEGNQIVAVDLRIDSQIIYVKHPAADQPGIKGTVIRN
jgi:cell division protein FtsQ